MNTGKTGIGRFFKGFVYAFEGVVSCIKTERDKNPFAKKAKDCAAGAVLIAAVASVAVGIRIFWDYYAFMAIASYFARNIWLGIALAAGVILWLVWVFKMPADKDKKDKEKYI